MQRLMARQYADLSDAWVVPDLVYGKVVDQGLAPICTFASPMTYISKDDPPFLIIHGDEDQTAPVSQSKIFAQAVNAADVPTTLGVVVVGRGHGTGCPRFEPMIKVFLDENLHANHFAEKSPSGSTIPWNTDQLARLLALQNLARMQRSAKLTDGHNGCSRCAPQLPESPVTCSSSSWKYHQN